MSGQIQKPWFIYIAELAHTHKKKHVSPEAKRKIKVGSLGHLQRVVLVTSRDYAAMPVAQWVR